MIAVGAAVTATFFGGFTFWAATAPLSSAALAPAVVKVNSSRKTIQHQEGGIIREILVREGDEVRKGQLLFRLDAVDANADEDAAKIQLVTLRATEARLLAQRDDKHLSFPVDLEQHRSSSQLGAVLSLQERVFADQVAATISQIALWHQRAEQLKAQFVAAESQAQAQQTQLALVELELRDVTLLFEKGLSPKPRLLTLQRQRANLQGEYTSAKSRIEVLREQMKETDLQINAINRTRAREISEELRDVQAKRAAVEQQLLKASARADRREVFSPQNGRVMNLRVVTLGGVVAPGGALLDLIPAEDTLVLEARVQPLDIDVVRPGLPASVRLVAYKQRTTPTLVGHVSQISADVVEGDRTSYYRAVIEVEGSELARARHVQLYPGMPVEVAIVTGSRTMLDYLLQPLTDSFSRAFRED